MSIGLFIDGAYAQKVVGGNINYLNFRNLIESTLGDQIDEAYYFNADNDPPRAQRLHNALTYPLPTGPGLRVKIYWLHKKKLFWPPHLGGEAVVHPTKRIQYELVTQKAVDVGLTYHMIRSHSKRGWTKLALVAGDGDFHEPVQNLVESENVDLHIFGSMNSISEDLRSYARTIHEIDTDPLKSAIVL